MAGPEPVSVHTRAQAITDGALVDVTELAWEACFRYPVAVTSGVWDDVQRVPKRGRDDADGRLGDLIWTAHLAAPQLAESACVYYWLQMPVGRKRMYRAMLVLGPGDRGELVATIMRPDEYQAGGIATGGSARRSPGEERTNAGDGDGEGDPGEDRAG